MKIKTILTVAALTAIPTMCFAQAAGGAAKPSKEEIDKVVKSIQADAAKQKQYCDMMKLYDQAAEAEDKKDSKASQEAMQKADEASKALGADYEKLMTSLQQIDPQSKDGQELASALDPLDTACGGAAKK